MAITKDKRIRQLKWTMRKIKKFPSPRSLRARRCLNIVAREYALELKEKTQDSKAVEKGKK